ncbi:mitochondrial ribosomal protein subunit L20-domain-containing protein [Crucibulum laeve]|uniref:Mitochondrial ribosomal protein subunit L20-domain-containing protein n=1 Tax=Crucibulum laeve TaxID=68775 RepID=A0A5C3M5M4_9AGAR|nr:mitochondrial ribosomal protein subunit L20-domain-containing protein [Crucibulum laeve]
MNIFRRLASSPALTRSYASKYPRPRPGTSERPAYHAPDPLVNNPKAAVTPLKDNDIELTFIHRPPPTAPSPFSLTTAPISPLLNPAPSPIQGALPPLVSRDKPQPERVSEETIVKIRQLRFSDPKTYSCTKLAKMFDCTTRFISLVAANKKSQRKALWKIREEGHAAARAKWSERHAIVKAIRAKRRLLW